MWTYVETTTIITEYLGEDTLKLGFPSGSVVKNPPANAGGNGSIPESGRSAGEGNDNPLQYSCLGNPRQRSLAGYSPRGCKELDETEYAHTHFEAMQMFCFSLKVFPANFCIHQKTAFRNYYCVVLMLTFYFSH